jgi:hypothetical protein
MRIRRLVVVVGFLLTPAVASADGHRWDLFGGLSFAEGSLLTGFHFNGEHYIYKHAFLVGDYSWHDGSGFKRQVFQGGVNFSKDKGPTAFSGRILAGRVADDAGKDTTVTGGLGFQVSLKSTAPLAQQQGVRVVAHVQADYIERLGEHDAFWRYSFGLLVRFPR